MRVLYGGHNFCDSLEDKNWIEFVYPTWKDILNNVLVNRLEHNVRYLDIRLIKKIIEGCNINDLQVLYSLEQYGCGGIKWVFENRDRLIRHNLWKLYRVNKKSIDKFISSDDNKSVIKAYIYTCILVKLIKGKKLVYYDNNILRIYDELNDIRKKELRLWCKEYVQSIEPEYKAYNDKIDLGVIEELDKLIEGLLLKHLCI